MGVVVIVAVIVAVARVVAVVAVVRVVVVVPYPHKTTSKRIIASVSMTCGRAVIRERRFRRFGSYLTEPLPHLYVRVRTLSANNNRRDECDWVVVRVLQPEEAKQTQ